MRNINNSICCSRRITRFLETNYAGICPMSRQTICNKLSNPFCTGKPSWALESFLNSCFLVNKPAERIQRSSWKKIRVIIGSVQYFFYHSRKNCLLGKEFFKGNRKDSSVFRNMMGKISFSCIRICSQVKRTDFDIYSLLSCIDYITTADEL